MEYNSQFSEAFNNSKDIGRNPFLFLNYHPKEYNKKVQAVLDKDINGDSVDTNTLGLVFMSNENVELIQKKLILTILKESNGLILINRQKDADLLFIMKYVYNNYSRHLPFKIKEQIRELNNKVVELIKPDLMSNIQQHIDYIKEINKPREINTLPVNTNIAGSNGLSSSSNYFR